MLPRRAPAPAASNTNAATRKTNGCTDTRNNSTDFALAPPSPRNTFTQINLCSITALLNACSKEGELLDSLMPSLSDAITTLRQHFGFDDFREGQREVIGSILEGKDAVVVMPTGAASHSAINSRR